MLCPECGSELIERGERFPECEDCGFTKYDEFTLSVIAETKREYEEAKRFCWPEKVPSYREYREMRNKRHD